MTPFLEVIGLRKQFSSQSAVGPVAFHVEEGEFLSLLGPSGCGKTTTLRCIAGFAQPTAGDIRIQGRSILPVPPHRRDIGLVFQNYALFPHLSAFENVAFGLRLRHLPDSELVQRATEALEVVGLSGYVARFPGELSGGQQQRVALARSLVLRPRLLLLDEPLSNLDTKMRVLMRGEIRRLQQQVGITTIYVTHDQTEALALSDRVAVMNQGVVCQIATPREIYNRPATPFVANFIGESNLLPGRVHGGHGTSMVSLDGIDLRSGEDPPAWLGPGREAMVLLRPERIRLAEPTDAVNAFGARVREATYLGEDVHLVVELDSGLRLTAMIESLTDRDPAVGERLRLAVAPSDVHLIQPDRQP
jgi:ABC-type Fe3+/spermidine/putrescine transport system ATPase subunit